MSTYVFDPDAMRHYAGTVRSAGTAVNNAALQLLMVQPIGLPPEAQGRVESQCTALWRMLSQGASGLDGGAGLLTRMAGAVERADSATLKVAGLDLVRVTRTGDVVIRELSDRAYGRKGPLGERALRWAKALGAVTGKKAIDVAVGYAEFRKAAREAKVSGSAARVLSATLKKRALDALDEANELRNRPKSVPLTDLRESNSKRWANRLLGYVPGPLGDAADVLGYVAASEKLRADEPQTGLSQAATDLRDGVNLGAASFHLAADGLFKTP
ncbi:MAG: hypothetical protein ACRDTU_22085, partial [Micromonosporaceae bacterium]